MMRLALGIGLAFFLGNFSAFAQPSSLDLEALDHRLAEIVETEGVVGASVAIADADGVIFARGYGYADREAGLEASAEIPFRAGSVSKLFTALAAMRLVEAGRLELETPLQEIAPDIAFTNRFEADSPVRLVHLMEHTTGWDDIQLQEYRSFPAGTTITEGLADNPVSRTSRWAPGLYASYANSGPAVMGRVIEMETGLSYEDAAETLVLAPLGLESASFDQDAPDRHIASYGADGERSTFTRIWATPSGGLSIAARDLVEIGRTLMVGGEGFISPDTIARMEHGETSLAAEAGVPVFGLGLYQERSDTSVWTGHAGAIDTAQAEVFYDRDSGLTYALMVNTAGRGMWEMKTALRAALVPTATILPETETDWRLPEGADGFYRIINPRVEMNRIVYDLLGHEHVWQCEAELCVNSATSDDVRRYTPYGGGWFYKTEEPRKRLALIEVGPQSYQLVYAGGESWARSGLTGVILTGVTLGLTLVFLASGTLSLLVWLVARPFGVFRGSNRWTVWIWPSLSALTLGAGLVAFVLLASGDALVNFAGPSLTGRVLQLGTFLFGPIALVGVWAAFRAPQPVLASRIHAGVTSVLLSLCWAYMLSYGWAGLTPWSYVPKVLG